MDRASVRYFQTAVATREVVETPSGSSIIKNVPVFREGKFKDSAGEPHTWEVGHLQQMVTNFRQLRDTGVLPNVPVRNQHKGLFGGGEVVGYVHDLRVEGTDSRGNALLVADMEITEPDALEKINRGTWRARSSEVGVYETNDEVMHWPVFMGVAWVDIPAVEGLFANHQTSNDKFTPVRDDEEATVGTQQDDDQNGGTEAVPSTTVPPVTEENPGGDQAQEQEEEHQNGGENTAGEVAPDPETAGKVETDEEPKTAPQEYATSAPVHTFSINGSPTNDFAAVQRHISNLESVLGEVREQSRKDFVSSLASTNRIAATQVDAMTAHALSLTDDQYAAFSAMYEAAPEVPLFSMHGQGNATDPEQVSEIDTLRERVALHTKSGLPEEKVRATPSYKRLMELTNNQG
jgi:hypothetical protein